MVSLGMDARRSSTTACGGAATAVFGRADVRRRALASLYSSPFSLSTDCGKEEGGALVYLGVLSLNKRRERNAKGAKLDSEQLQSTTTKPFRKRKNSAPLLFNFSPLPLRSHRSIPLRHGFRDSGEQDHLRQGPNRRRGGLGLLRVPDLTSRRQPH